MKNIFLVLLMFIVCDLAFGQFTDLQEAKLNLMNLYSNPGAEAQLDGWSETGGGTLTTDTSTKRSGKAAIKFTSSATSDYLNFPVVVVKKGTNNCEASFYYKTTSTVYDTEIYINSVRVAILDLNAATEFTKAIVTFVCTDFVNSTQAKITNGANTDIIYIDDAYIGDNLNIGSVNLQDKEYDITTQVTGDNGWSTIYASARVKKDRSATPSWRVEGNISGTSNNVGGGTTVSVTIAGLVSKNTANFTQSCVVSDTTNFTTGRCRIDPNTGVLNLDNAAATTTRYIQFSILLESKPTWATDYAEQVIRAERTGNFAVLDHNSASNTASTGSLAGISIAGGTKTYRGKAEATTSGNWGLKVVNMEPGDYGIEFNLPFNAYDGDQGNTCEYEIYDETNSVKIASTEINQVSTPNGTATRSSNYGIKGVLNYNSLTTASYILRGRTNAFAGNCYAGPKGFSGNISAVVFPINGTISIPQIINSVQTSYSGQLRIESVKFAGATISTACTSSPCTLYQNTGGISTVTRSAQGNYSVNFVSGTYSQSPTCSCNPYGINSDWGCFVRPVDENSVNIRFFDLSNSFDESASINCIGIK